MSSSLQPKPVLNFFPQPRHFTLPQLKEEYPQYVNPDEEFYNEGIDSLMNANLNPDAEELMEILFKGYDYFLDYLFYEKK